MFCFKKITFTFAGEMMTFMPDLLTSFLPKELRTKFLPLVEPAQRLGIRLGDVLADGWDCLIDRAFGISSVSAN